MPDFLDGGDDPYAAYGAARAYSDLGYAPPKSGLGGWDEYVSPRDTTVRSARPAAAPRVASSRSAKPFDPLDDPEYKRTALARKELYDTEQYARQALSHFASSHADDLAAVAAHQKALGGAAGAVRGGKPDENNELSAASLALLDPKAPWANNLGGAALHPRVPNNARAILQTRQRLADEFKRTSDARQQYDEQTFTPLRQRLMTRTSAEPTVTGRDPMALPDYLAPQGNSEFDQRVNAINLRRQQMNQPAIAPGSVSAGNFTEPWGPAQQPSSLLRDRVDLTPQNNPPGDEARGEGDGEGEPGALPATAESAPPQPGLPPQSDTGAKGGLSRVFGADEAPRDVLDNGARSEDHRAMATDLKAAWGSGSVTDRVKMMFGSKGYGSNEIEWPEDVIGSEAGGTKGSLYTIPKAEGTGTSSGLINAANKFSAGLLTPTNAALAAATGGAGVVAELGGVTAIGKAAQALKAAAVAGFTVQMASGLPDSIRRAVEVMGDPKSTDADKAEALATPGLEAAMTALAGHGAVKEGAAFGDRTRGESAPSYGNEPKLSPFGPGLNPSRFTEDPAFYDAARKAGAVPQVGRDLTNGSDPTLSDETREAEAAAALREFQGFPAGADESTSAAAQEPSNPESNERESGREEPVETRGINPPVGVVDPGSMQSSGVRSDLDRPGEQPRGIQEPPREPSGAGVGAAPDADERLAGSGGEPRGTEPLGPEPQPAGAGAAPARGAEGDLGGGGAGQPHGSGAGEGERGNAEPVAERPGIIIGSRGAEWAKRILRERAGQVSSGLDPELIAAYAINGAEHMERGARDFATWSAAMVREHGEQIKEHLEKLWDDAAAYFKDPSLVEKAMGGPNGDQRGGSFVFASPNKGNLSFDEAQQALESAAHRQFHSRAQELAGPSATVTSGIGDWSDGAENSLLVEDPNGTESSAEKTGARLGLEGEQKQVLHGVYDENGPDLMHEVTFPSGTPLGTARKALTDAGISFRFLNEGKGGITTKVFDQEGKQADNFNKLSEHESQPSITTKRARGTFSGDPQGVSREVAAEDYRRRLGETPVQPANKDGGGQGELRDNGAPGAAANGGGEAGGGPNAPARPVPPEAAQVGGGSGTPPTVAMTGGGSAGAEGKPIGVKNASVDEQRASLGLPPSQERHGTTQAEAHAAATARIAADKDVGAKLVDKLHESPRAPDATETIILDHELVQRRKAVDAAEGRWNEAAKTGDKAAMDTASAEANEAQAAYNKAMDVSEAVGTKSSDSLNMRKAMLKEDFSLANLTRQQERLNRGKPVTDEQKATIKQEHEDYEKTKADYEKKLAESEQKRAEAEYDAAYQKAASKIAWEKKTPPASRASILQRYAEHEAQAGAAAMARIKARIASGKTLGAVVPLDVDALKDWVDVARDYMARGIVKGADLAAAMVKAGGEAIRPHLDQILKSAVGERTEFLKSLAGGRDTPTERKSTVAAMKERIADGDTIGDLGRYVNKVAEQHLRDGVKGREALLDAVHGTLKEVNPDISRRETMDALSGYGQMKPLNPDPIKAELRDIKGQSQQIAKLQDMQAGQAPLKTGIERRVPSDEERRLIKQVDEAKKKGGYDVTDPAKQLKSSLDAIKTRLTNQIKDFDFQISTGKRLVRDKTTAPTDAEADALRTKRDALKKEYDEMFKRPGLTDEQRIKLATRSVERAIADYENQIKTGAYARRTKGSAGPTNAALDALRANRDALREQRDDLRNQANPGLTPEQRNLQSRKSALARRTAKLQDQLARDYFSKPARKLPPTDRALELAQLEHEKVKARSRDRQYKQEQANRTWPEKGIDVVPKISRAFKLSHLGISGKLAAAAAARMVHSVAREGVISGLRQIPGIKGIAARAPRFGPGFHIDTEVKAHTAGIMRAIRATGQYLQNKEPEERILYGKPHPGDFDSLLGRVLHASLKTPAMMTEFERSLEYNSQFDKNHGLDPSDPVVKMRNGIAALKDADRSIFLQKGLVSGLWRAALAYARNYKGTDGKKTLTGRTIAAVAETKAPIVTVPTNILGEALEHMFGVPTGIYKAAKAHWTGLDNIPREAHDDIMRTLAHGTMGPALLIAGWYLYKDIGPFHQTHEKKRTDVPKDGTAVIGGQEVPKAALHNVPFGLMQTAATAHYLMDGYAQSKGEPMDWKYATVKSLFGLAESQPFVRETVDFGKMVENPKGTIPREVGNQVVPGASQDLARWFDKDAQGNPFQRKPEGTLENIEMNVPGLRQNVPLAAPPRTPAPRRQSQRDYLDEASRRR